MSKKGTYQVHHLFNELAKSTKSVGISGTISALQQNQKFFRNHFEAIKSFILKKSSLEFNMDETSMIKGKGRSDNRMYALSFATVLLLKYLKINGTQAGEILEKDDSSICRFKKNIRSLKSNLVKEKELMDKMSIMELEVEAYIDMLNQHKYKNLVNEQQSSKVK